METTTKFKTAAERIIDLLTIVGGWHAVHELNIRGISDCAASARLRELARTGKVVSRFRENSRYKEWAISDPCDITDIC